MDEFDNNPEFNVFLDGTGRLDDEGLSFEVGYSGIRIRPSQALWMVQRREYRDELDKWKADKLLENRLRFKELTSDCANGQRCEKVVKAIRAHRVVPFVGAGLSIPSGCPGWEAFLLGLVEEVDESGVLRGSLEEGRFEQVAEELCVRMGQGWFDEQVERAFEVRGDLVGPVRLLPSIFESCVTTNLDNILENLYKQHGSSFDQRMQGRFCSNFMRVAGSGERWLLKLHGHYGDPEGRIFLALLQKV